MSLQPNWALPPGATISRLMAAREIPQDDLADCLEITVSELDSLIVGRARITQKIAKSLSDNLGGSVRLWLTRDKTYIRDLARINEAQKLDVISWAKSMPVKSMRKYGWISKSTNTNGLANDVLRFFGCASLHEWGVRYSDGIGAVAFKTSLAFEADAMATLVWLRASEQQIDEMRLPQFDRNAFAARLAQMKKLSAFKHPSSFLPRLRAVCGQFGVGLTTARAPEGCRASGATWVTASGHPVIHLSFRHMSEDHFWFTFFHEAAHVILHGENHIDSDGVGPVRINSAEQESEADTFAQELLIPQAVIDRLSRSKPTPKSVLAVARENDVTSGIVVGQLEKANIVPHGKLSFMKHRYRWDEDASVPNLAS